MKRLLLLLFSCVLFLQPYCQAQPLTSEESPVTLSTATGDIKGRLLLPANATTCPVVLLIAGSGPTDMDGNNPMMKNNSLKFLAEGLAQKGIASLRFDKRGIAGSAAAGKEESKLRFEDYVNDVTGWIDFLAKDKRFTGITVAGLAFFIAISPIYVEPLFNHYTPLPDGPVISTDWPGRSTAWRRRSRSRPAGD